MINPAWRNRVRNNASDVLAVWLGLGDPRVPRVAKGAALFSVLYLLMPFDLIPDMLPVVGWLDDLLVLPLSAFAATRLMPFAVLRDLRRRADARIVLWGRAALPLAVAIVCLWLMVAATGGWLAWNARSSAPSGPAATGIPESILRELARPLPTAP